MQLNNKWDHEFENMIVLWRKTAIKGSTMHATSARRLQLLHYAVSGLGITFGAFTLISLATNFSQLENPDALLAINIIALVFTMLQMIASGITNLLQLNKDAERHARVSMIYHSIAKKIDVILNTRISYRSDAEVFCTDVRRDFEIIDVQKPTMLFCAGRVKEDPSDELIFNLMRTDQIDLAANDGSSDSDVEVAPPIAIEIKDNIVAKDKHEHTKHSNGHKKKSKNNDADLQ